MAESKEAPGGKRRVRQLLRSVSGRTVLGSVVLAPASLFLWYVLRGNQAESSHPGHDFNFEYDPIERFSLDKTNSWIVTALVIVLAVIYMA